MGLKRARDEFTGVLYPLRSTRQRVGAHVHNKHVRHNAFQSGFSLTNVANALRDAKRVVIIAGAGISVSAGIPDFRSKGTGLYDNLDEYDLEGDATNMFDLEYFKEHPQAFNTFVHNILPGESSPTRTHSFLKLLSDKGMVQRIYTQNIDMLEAAAGIDSSKVIYTHGNFNAAQCVECKKPESYTNWRYKLKTIGTPRCDNVHCGGLLKPTIVFFGEELPARYLNNYEEDMQEADFLLVLGTSLQVAPVCRLPALVKEEIPRVLINLQKVGSATPSDPLPPMLRSVNGNRRRTTKLSPPRSSFKALDEVSASTADSTLPFLRNSNKKKSQTTTVNPPNSFQFDCAKNFRDVFLEGKTDDIVEQLARKLGWGDDLEAIRLATPDIKSNRTIDRKISRNIPHDKENMQSSD
eukprot:GEMP01003663.1.p1 GENE.GEMP01003663.1~~GEMP01003663.1.p1  ORF type:complete len:409 (+),score=77.03 GEMP01003663.1:180-1406(+)